MSAALRLLAALGFGTVVAYGLAWRDGISDARWLGLLAAGWLLLLLAAWPRLPATTPTFNRTALHTATLIVTVFVVLSVQLVRIQIVASRATVERVATDPLSAEVIANPRIQIDDLEIRRGTVRDRRGTILAQTLFDGGVARRVYPDPESGYVVGYFSPLLYGKDGLEATYDAELSGQNGNNAVVRGLDDLLNRPRRGLDLDLTLDAELQRAAHVLLADRPGAAVLLDVETGAVLALASNPHYDPNALFTASPGERDAAAGYWSSLIEDPLSPLLHRAVDARFTPGSTFKVLTAAAVIDAGFATPDDVYEDNGQLDVDGHIVVEYNRPDDTRDAWTLREGLAWSLNVVFARVGLELGPSVMRDYAARFGFGAAPPFDLPVIPSQLASSPEFVDAPPALADTGFGQGEILATPLQMALVAAAVANDGVIMRPTLVAALRDADGDAVRGGEPRPWQTPITADTAAQVQDMMVYNVESGIAQAALVDGYTVGGKTGTAETGDGDSHAWFIGFIGEPNESPRYAVAVVLERGGTGLVEALGVGRDLLVAGMEATE